MVPVVRILLAEELAAELIGVQYGAVGLGEHGPVVLVVGAHEELLLILAGSDASQHLAGCRVKADRLADIGLGELLDPKEVIDDGDPAGDDRDGGIEIIR